MSTAIAYSTAEDLRGHSRGLRRVAQDMHDLEKFLGGSEDVRTVLYHIRAQMPSALQKYRQHLLVVLSRCKTAGLQPDEELLFALRIYASTCAQTMSEEMLGRATLLVDAYHKVEYALFTFYLSHERADVLFALKAGVLAFEMSLL